MLIIINMIGGDADVLGVMNFIAFILLFAVTMYIVIEIKELKDYDDANEKQLTNLVDDINYNNYVISNNNPDIVNMN